MFIRYSAFVPADKENITWLSNYLASFILHICITSIFFSTVWWVGSKMYFILHTKLFWKLSSFHSQSQCEFATELSCWRENIFCVDGLLSSVCAGDNAAIKNNEEAPALEHCFWLKQAGAYSVSFGWWIHLRNHLSGWLRLTEPRTDCDRSCCLARQGQTFPYWCSKVRDKKQLGGLGTESSVQNTFQSTGERNEWESIVLRCSHLQTLNHPHNVQITDSCFPHWSINKHCHRV